MKRIYISEMLTLCLTVLFMIGCSNPSSSNEIIDENLTGEWISQEINYDSTVKWITEFHIGSDNSFYSMRQTFHWNDTENKWSYPSVYESDSAKSFVIRYGNVIEVQDYKYPNGIHQIYCMMFRFEKEGLVQYQGRIYTGSNDGVRGKWLYSEGYHVGDSAYIREYELIITDCSYTNIIRINGVETNRWNYAIRFISENEIYKIDSENRADVMLFEIISGRLFIWDTYSSVYQRK